MFGLSTRFLKYMANKSGLDLIKYHFHTNQLSYYLFGTFSTDIIKMEYPCGYQILAHINQNLMYLNCKFAVLDEQLIWAIRDKRICMYNSYFNFYIFVNQNETDSQEQSDDHFPFIKQMEKVLHQRSNAPLSEDDHFPSSNSQVSEEDFNSKKECTYNIYDSDIYEQYMNKIYTHLLKVYRNVFINYDLGLIQIYPSQIMTDNGTALYFINIFFLVKEIDPVVSNLHKQTYNYKWIYVNDDLQEHFPNFYITQEEASDYTSFEYDNDNGKIYTISGYDSYLKRYYPDYMTNYNITQKYISLFQEKKITSTYKIVQILNINTIEKSNNNYLPYYVL